MYFFVINSTACLVLITWPLQPHKGKPIISILVQHVAYATALFFFQTSLFLLFASHVCAPNCLIYNKEKGK